MKIRSLSRSPLRPARSRTLRWIALCGLLFAFANSTLARDPVVRLEIEPPSVHLDSRRSTAQLVVTGRTDSGERRDLTSSARIRTEDPLVVRIEGSRVVPVADGETRLRVEADGLSAEADIVVRSQSASDPIRFHSEVLAVLTKQGCNSGSCHGSPQGKGGFALSLFAYAPDLDAHSLVRADRGRRVSLLRADDSLFLKKPTLRVAHKGGRRLARNSLEFRVLRDWVHEGATIAFESEPRCVALEVSPSPARVLFFHDASTVEQQLRVVARFSDGSARDVTAIASYDSSDPDVATVDARAKVVGLRRGQVAISVRYLDELESVHFTFVRDVPGFEWNGDAAGAGIVDRLVHARLRLLQIPVSPGVSDSVFLRRVRLDLTGLLPTADEAREFLGDPSPHKRRRLVDRLLASEAHARFWGQKRADLLRVRSDLLSEAGARAYGNWIVSSVRDNMPSDDFVHRLLTTSADLATAPEASYFFTAPDPSTLTETTAQLFMGARVNCAKCHNHPFEAWTQNDYYHIAAAFGRVAIQGDPKKDPASAVVSVAAEGEVSHPTSGRVMPPWPIGPAEASARGDAGDRRVRFARWLTSASNRDFPRVEVNRIWAELFGRGLVDPVDDFRSSNPPANPELLDALAAEFVRSGFDRKHVLRLVLNSQTYQRSTKALDLNRDDERLGSRMIPRLLTAEQLHDALLLLTGEVVGAEPGRRFATQNVLPPRTEFLSAFGAPERSSPCACERRSEPTLPQLLQVMNGQEVHQRIRAAAQRYRASETLVGDLYLAALARPPTQAERAPLGILSRLSRTLRGSRGRSRLGPRQHQGIPLSALTCTLARNDPSRLLDRRVDRFRCVRRALGRASRGRIDQLLA